jgi:Leucine-rich repeat (LRR) protein
LIGNALTEVPSSIESLTCLKKLYLNGTKITKLPKSLWSLPDLKEIHIAKCKVLLVREEAGKDTTDCILILFSISMVTIVVCLGMISK